jgi:hypothetical protein
MEPVVFSMVWVYSLDRRLAMRRNLVFWVALGPALFAVPSQTGCGSNDCAQLGESCMTKECCPTDSGASVSRDETFKYDNGLQVMTSCMCL